MLVASSVLCGPECEHCHEEYEYGYLDIDKESKCVTYDMLDAPQVLRSSQESLTQLTLPELLPGSKLP